MDAELELREMIELDKNQKLTDADLQTFNCWIDGPDSDSDDDGEEEEADEEEDWCEMIVCLPIKNSSFDREMRNLDRRGLIDLHSLAHIHTWATHSAAICHLLVVTRAWTGFVAEELLAAWELRSFCMWSFQSTTW